MNLRDIPLFSELSADELSRLKDVMRERSFPKGNVIVFAEDEGNQLMILTEGSAKVSLMSDEGKEVILAQLRPGDYFGEMALLTGEERSANVTANTKCTVLVMSAKDFETQCRENSGFALALLRELAVRLRVASGRIGDFALLDVYRRTAKVLASLGKEEQQGANRVVVVDPRPTHQELASMVGTSREMVTRSLKDLEDAGCIAMEGKRVSIIELPE